MKKNSVSISLELSILGLTGLEMSAEMCRCREHPRAPGYAQNTPHSSPSSPTVSPRALCCGRSRVPWLLANRNFAPGCISGQKHQGSDDTPLGRVQQTSCGLSPLADGWWMWVKHVVVIVPVHPGTFTTPTYFTQHAPTFGPRTQFAWSHGTTLAGCHQTPNASTTETTWARDSACREPWHPMMTKHHPWADGWELSADRILKEGKRKEFYSK